MYSEGKESRSEGKRERKGRDGDGKAKHYSSQNAVKTSGILNHSNATDGKMPERFTKAVHGRVN